MTDDTKALSSWIAALSPLDVGYAPPGIYVFKTPLGSTKSGIAIKGAGLYQTTFAYAGTATTSDLFTINGGSNWSLTDFRITSYTQLTGGTALHLKGFVRSSLAHIIIDGQDGTGKLWNGFWFDGVDFVTLEDFQARAQNDAIRVNGSVANGPKADLFLRAGKVSGSGIGLHVGGGFGGLFADQLDIIANGVGILIDTQLREEGNREIFLGPLVAIDSPQNGAALDLADRLANSSAYLQMSGTWLASGAQDGLRLESGVRWIVQFEGGTIFNFKGAAISMKSYEARCLLNGTLIRGNGADVLAADRSRVLDRAIYIDNTSASQSVGKP